MSLPLNSFKEKSMIKECKVLLNNEAVAVVDFDGVHVQIPSVAKNVKSVFVELKDGSYNVVDKPVMVGTSPVCEAVEVTEQEEIKKPVKKARKKKPVEEE